MKPIMERNHGVFHIDAFEQVLKGYPKTGSQWLSLNGYSSDEVDRIRNYYQF